MEQEEDLETQKRAWVNLSRRDIPRAHRLFHLGQRKQFSESKKLAELCLREVKFSSAFYAAKLEIFLGQFFH